MLRNFTAYAIKRKSARDTLNRKVVNFLTENVSPRFSGHASIKRGLNLKWHFFLNPRDQEKTTLKRLLRLSLLLKTFIFIILDIVFNNKIYTALHMVILLGLYGLIPFLIRVYMMITHGIVNGFEEGTEYIKIFSPPLTVQ